MSLELLSNRLEFLREAERLKDVLRSAHLLRPPGKHRRT